MRLPVPFAFGASVFREAEPKEPSGGLLADTRKAAEGGNYFSALAAFVGGGMSDCGGETNPAQLKILAREMPYLTAEAIAIESLKLGGAEDLLDAVWACPRCGTKVVSGEDDRISALTVNYAEEPVLITHGLRKAVSVERSDGEGPLVYLSEMTLAIPTLNHYIRAFNRYGSSDPVRVELAALVESTVSVEGEPVSQSWKSSLGMIAMNAMDSRDLRDIDGKIKAWGRQNRVEKHCPSCGKAWMAEVSAAGFFASGLADR